MNEFDILDGQIQLTLLLHLHKLQRDFSYSITFDNLVDTLMGSIWKKRLPKSLHEAVNDILSLSADQVIRFLSTKAIIDGYKADLSEFNDLIGGCNYEQEEQ